MYIRGLFVIAAIAAFLGTFGGVTSAKAANEDGSVEASGVGPQLAPGTLPRFRVGYMRSRSLSGFPRSATVITVVNEATTPCTISVDWRLGFSATGIGGVVCTTTFVNLERGQSAEFCSRDVPSNVSLCNSICAPALTADEGNAVVGSTNTAACAKITVSPRIYYFGNTTDTSIQAITDPAVAKFAVGNVGD